MGCVHCERKLGEPFPVRSKVPPEWVDRYAFMRSLPRGLTVAELGVYEGEFSAMLLKWMEPGLDVMVDFWMPYGTPRIKPLQTQEEWDTRYKRVCVKFAKEVADGQVVIHRNTFSNATNKYDDGYFDFIHHDGDKTYDHVYCTLEDWWPLLRPGGLWMGKDFACVIDNDVIGAVMDFHRSHDDAAFIGITRADWSPSYVLRKDM